MSTETMSQDVGVDDSAKKSGEPFSSPIRAIVGSSHDHAKSAQTSNGGADTSTTLDGDQEQETEALSHKEVRKRRKLEKQAARIGASNISNGDANPSGPSVHPSRAVAVAIANQSASGAAPKRSRHFVWIGNLSFRTSADRLQEWFEEKGIAGISRVHMPSGQKKTDNRGFAYVDIPTAETMQSCIDLSEDHLDGRRLLIKAGTDYSGRPEIDKTAAELATGLTSSLVKDDSSGDSPAGTIHKGKTGLTKTAQKVLRAQKNPPGPTLFVGNLSFNSTENGLREMIERAAAARDVWNGGEKSKGKGKEKSLEKSDNGESDQSDEEGSEAEAKCSDEEKIIGKAGKERKKRAGKEGDKAELLRGAGIRKIRMGEFEDTGKCKGFAFVDFFSPAYATASLIDPRNLRLDGRELLLQYASAEAVRRGAPKGQINGPRPVRDGPRPNKRPYRDFATEESSTTFISEPAPVPGTFDADAPLPKKHKETQEERIKRREAQGSIKARRAKPGAALANAPRGKTSIALDAPKAVKKTFD